jgi:hypothetical protein
LQVQVRRSIDLGSTVDIGVVSIDLTPDGLNLADCLGIGGIGRLDVFEDKCFQRDGTEVIEVCFRPVGCFEVSD